MNDKVIPNAAVEAAGAAYASGETGGEIWGHIDYDAEARRRALAILEAAAPYMLAEAWDDGHSAGIDHADGLDGGSNPYDRPAP